MSAGRVTMCAVHLASLLSALLQTALTAQPLLVRARAHHRAG